MRTAVQLKMTRAFIDRVELISKGMVNQRQVFMFMQLPDGSYSNTLLMWTHLKDCAEVAREGLDMQDAIRGELDNITTQIAALQQELTNERNHTAWYFFTLALSMWFHGKKAKTRKS